MCVADLPVALEPLWQVAQLPAATPVWLNSAPKKETVLLWQVQQSALVTTWFGFAVLLTGVTPANAWPLWQLMQPVTMPLWFIVVPVKLLVFLWQVSQLKVVGRWLPGLAITPAVTPWQVAQEPGATVGWTNVAPRNELVPLWQVSQPAEVMICVDGLNTGVTPANAVPLWQFAQPVTMPVWFMTPPAKLAPILWQVSQLKAVAK